MDAKGARSHILCVDDEQNVLDSMALHLRRSYEVRTARSGLEGLQVLEEHGPFAVVISDMRKHKMNGATFLKQVKETYPDTVRLLLTGYATIESALAAVNEGHIFRFLTKPCPPGELQLAVQAAVEQHRLIVAERFLLEQTLRGSVKLLTDVLAMTAPGIFGRATRIKRYVAEMLEHEGKRSQWDIEVAAMLSQIGYVTLPTGLIDQIGKRPLTAEEQRLVEGVPAINLGLVGGIPGLEPVATLLQALDEPREKAPWGSRLLKLAIDYDELDSQGIDPKLAIETLRGRNVHDPERLEAFASLRGDAEQKSVLEVSVKDLRIGMILAQDLWTETGALLVGRGYQITESFLMRARNFPKGFVVEPLRVVVPKA